jgi:class 3 adenylate cyclase
MGMTQELQAEVAKVFKERWSECDGRAVPDPDDLGLSNDGVNLDATVLYADMAESTDLVDTKKAEFAAEVYKTYLICAARIIKDEGGSITAYDGDRIMAVFVGDTKNSTAARAALKINGAVIDIINPALVTQYSNSSYRVRHRVGIDTSSTFVRRVGVRNDNDLVWVGRAANYAAKLCAIPENNTVFISEAVFNRLQDASKYGGNPRQLMWRERKWSQMGDKRIYSSAWKWSP